MPTVLVFFVVACVLYVLARMVSAPIPAEGTVDLQRYHMEEGRKYAGLFAAECALTIGTVFLYGAGTKDWFATNWATVPTLAAALAAAATKNRWVQAGALLVILPLWVWYFATLQSALS